MNTIRTAAAGILAAAVLAAPAACGAPRSVEEPTAQPSVTAPVTTPAAPTPSTSVPAAPVVPPSATPGTTVVSARVAYQWHWPNDSARPGVVTHRYAVPPVPALVRIGAGDHPRDPGERPYNRMSFTFTTGFPSYEFSYVPALIGDGSGLPIPLEGRGVLRVVFRQAQAHTPDGTRSTIVAQPAADLGLSRMASYANAGDFEGVLTYGIGISWPAAHANPQIAVRVYEVTTQNAQGQRRYVVAIDVDATPLG